MKSRILFPPLTLACLLGVSATAQVNYEVSGGTAHVVSSRNASGNIVIASTYNGNPVTSIGGTAFYGCTNLTSVMIPDSVTSIEGYAFYGCASLTSVAIPNSVTFIGDWAFFGCTSLTSVTIPNSVTHIGFQVFYFCTSLTAITVDALNGFFSSVDGVLFNKSKTLLLLFPGGKAGGYTIPNSVTTIFNSAFSHCSSLSSVTIGNSVTSIGGFAFEHCTSLANVTIPERVTTIGNYAFSYCTSLSSITIGSNVTRIGYSAFGGCTSLSAITVDALNSFYKSVDGVLYDKSQALLLQFPGGKAGSYTIPNSVTNIDYGAFYACTSLTSVTIPNSVISIESYAFFNCTSLTGVYFQGNAPNPDSVDPYVFSNATNVTVYYLPGTTGWETTFSGRPAVLWNPVVATSDASFGVRTSRFGFTITATSDLVLVVEACTNLTNPTWWPVGTNTLTGGSSYFSYPEWTNHSVRFYRLRSP